MSEEIKQDIHYIVSMAIDLVEMGELLHGLAEAGTSDKEELRHAGYRAISHAETLQGLAKALYARKVNQKVH